MKMLQEYLDRAVEFEKLGRTEQNEELRSALLEQAKAYRKLAAARAKADFRLLARPMTPIEPTPSVFGTRGFF